MTDETILNLQANKSANIIKDICELYGVSLQEAIDIFYRSDTAQLIEEHVADLHCRSDKYLATLVWEEHLGSNNINTERLIS